MCLHTTQLRKATPVLEKSQEGGGERKSNQMKRWTVPLSKISFLEMRLYTMLVFIKTN